MCMHGMCMWENLLADMTIDVFATDDDQAYVLSVTL